MSLYTADVGDIILKPEVREDFGYFFEQNYSLVTNTLLKEFIADYVSTEEFVPFVYWRHQDEKKEWRGKYKTSYDKETGRFIYGVTYNMHGFSYWAMHIFLFDVLPELTEQELFHDGWVEPI